MKAINVINPGRDSSLTIGEVPTPEPGEHEILVKIEAAAINRADLLQRQGKYPPPEGASPILGLEMAGIVEKTGENVTRWKTGDFVFALLPGGGYAEFCIVHEQMAMPIPENISFVEAAAIPETFITAFQSLKWLGNLKRDEFVLIHAGGSGVGTSAIQLARKLFNARIVATAGADHKLETCRELGAEYTYNYNTTDFSEGIIEDIGRASIHLIIDFVGAPYWEKNIRVLATDGRIVYLSMLGGHKLESLSLLPILQKRLTIKGSTLRSRSESYKIELIDDFWKTTAHLFEEQIIQPVIDSEYDWEEAEQAHRRMAENKNTGKMVLRGM